MTDNILVENFPTLLNNIEKVPPNQMGAILLKAERGMDFGEGFTVPDELKG